MNEFFQQEVTTLQYTSDGRIVLDTTKSGIGSENGAESGGKIECGDNLRLDIYLDRSCVEIIVNGKYNISYTIRPTFADSLGVALTGEAELNSLVIHSMKGTR